MGRPAWGLRGGAADLTGVIRPWIYSYLRTNGPKPFLPRNKERMRAKVVVKATAQNRRAGQPRRHCLSVHDQFAAALIAAGITQRAARLTPPSYPWRIAFDRPQRKVIGGPFARTKALAGVPPGGQS